MQLNPNEFSRLHLWVTGRVQGVGFRAFVQDVAESLGVNGWVRNVGWNQVESVAEGPRSELEKFSQRVQRGPSVSRVDEFHEDWEIPTREFDSFEIRIGR